MVENLVKTIQEALCSFGIQVSDLKFLREPFHITTSPICVIIGLTTKSGHKKGIFSFELDQSCAKYVLSAMMSGYEVDVFSDVGMSAILELANIICGNALSSISPDLRSTPPTAVLGSNMKTLLNVLPSYKITLSMQNQILTVGLSVT